MKYYGYILYTRSNYILLCNHRIILRQNKSISIIQINIIDILSSLNHKSHIIIFCNLLDDTNHPIV